MNVLEIILIAFGMSLDIFGYTVCKSSSYAKIDKKKLGFYCLAFALWEFISLCLGCWTVKLILKLGIDEEGSSVLRLLAVTILVVMAVRMLIVGVKNEFIEERRVDTVSFWGLMHDNMFVALRTYLVGFAFAACGTGFGLELLILMITAIFCVLLGLYIGYRYGFGLRRGAYFLSSLLLICTDVSMFIRMFIAA